MQSHGSNLQEASWRPVKLKPHSHEDQESPPAPRLCGSGRVCTEVAISHYKSSSDALEGLPCSLVIHILQGCLPEDHEHMVLSILGIVMIIAEALIRMSLSFALDSPRAWSLFLTKSGATEIISMNISSNQGRTRTPAMSNLVSDRRPLSCSKHPAKL